MLPVALVAVFLFELALCLYFAYLALGNQMALHVSGITICILSYLVVVRVGLVMATFLVSHALNSRQPALRLHTRVAMMSKEVVFTLLAFGILIPMSFVFAPRLARKVPSNVVLMVHGFMSNSGIWWWLARRVSGSGRAGVDSLNLTPIFGDIENYVGQLERRIAHLKLSGARHILLVGHSMGGLVCRAWLQKNSVSGETADGMGLALVTVCTPWHGTSIASWVPGKNTAQMTRSSSWIRSHLQVPTVPALSLYSAHDNVVIPYTCGIDQKIESVEIEALGHLSVLFCPQIAAAIVDRCQPLAVSAVLHS